MAHTLESRQLMSRIAKAKGQTISFKGYKHSEESKQKMRLAKLGKKPTEKQLEGLKKGWSREVTLEQRKAISDRMKGENCHFWRGGVADKNKTERQNFMRSFEYRDWRKQIFERDDWTCRDCGVRGGKLCADHIKPYALFPELRLEVSNGQTLCWPCHRKTDSFGRRYDIELKGRAYFEV